MAQSNSAHEADPVINVIEQDAPGNSGGPAVSDERRERLESAAMDAVSARRRREFDAARARLRDQAIRDGVAAVPQDEVRSPVGTTTELDWQRAPLDRPPERVRKRYLRAGNQYFLKDAPYQLAFEDLGSYLVTEHNRPDVIESMIDMVQAKSWRCVRVSGHEAFRSEAWLQGTLLGIEVSGYAPKAADLARLADARQAWLDNRIEVAADVDAAAATGAQGRAEARAGDSPAPRDDSGATINRASQSKPVRTSTSEAPISETNRSAAIDEADAARRYAGELREHGRAPYQHNPVRSDSYYVVFRDDAGIDQVVWGVDLERAIREANVENGQQLTLENLGKHFVTVRAPILDDEGRVIGEEEKDVYRNTWQVEVVQCDLAASASAPQSDSLAGSEAQSLDVHAVPIAEQGSHRRRDAQHAQSERTLHLAVLTAAMREQGFSERSVARVQQRAERMLAAFQHDGVPVPTPKVFDPYAPSGRDRRKRAGPERVPAREIDRTPPEPSPPSPSR
ncbi:DNA primase [Burkholderia pseudomultivorans]|uniref:LPD7 domain-containing protein n=1 Tax=Burkholderia pseudomultivorans TaxID=1207504 RepID=UPI002876EC96|nr:LPD7 domain-containing protein [Burkholderia pseudomultivorans]MDS0858640.1 DNA primase [Burkholderia pseudomultivorans]